MRKSFLAKSIVTEYGLPWAFNRALYSAKLKLLNMAPVSEKLFEKPVDVKRVDIFHVQTDAISRFLKTVPQPQKEELIEAADKAMAGVIKGFSSVELDYGNPVHWQLNPLTGKHCPDDKRWYTIPDFDQERGDIKLVWEASRLTHFLLFARAYLLTEDRKYYQAFSGQLRHWLVHNVYPNGANYKCGQECALRMVNTLMAYNVFASCGLTCEDDEKNVAEMVTHCYQKILSNFFYAHKCIKNNHTLSELCGMIIGAWCCKEDAALEKAYRMLDKEICSQFTTDGGYSQFSFNYQRLAMQICNCVISLSGVTGKRLSAGSMERIKSSALLLYQCQSESGDVPNYGSNDGALIFPVTCCDYRNFRPTINTSHVLTAGSRLYSPGLHDEELLWFCGESPGETELARRSSGFPGAGLYTLRDNDSFAMICLNHYSSRPAHMDQLHIDLWYKGVNLFCDCGTYSYASALGKKLALTESHNTVKIADIEQMNPYGNFMVCNWSKALPVENTGTAFEGEIISQNSYSHRRRVELTSWGYRITDRVGSKKEYEIIFHTPLEVHLDGNTASLLHDGKTLCELDAGTSQIFTSLCHRSLYYMKAEKITSIHIVPDPARTQKIVSEIRLMER